jgi:hypothetical protein
MTFFTSRDHPGSISLVCDFFLDSHRLSGIFGANRDNYNFDIFDHPESISLVFDWLSGSCRLSGIFGANADNDILEYKNSAYD